MSHTQRQRGLAIIAATTGISVDLLPPQARLQEDLGCDFLDFIELLMALEDALDMCFSPEEDAAVTTVGDLFDLVERHAGAAP
jgi:acyl carrier protein